MAHHDFFSQAHSAPYVALPALTPVAPQLDDFARAIGSRIAPALVANPLACPTRPMAALRLSSPARAAGPSTQPASAPGTSEFRAVGPADLAALLGTPSTLVLDLRPNASYSSARLPNALSLSVPSTLLKRPAFSLQKLSTMMRSTSRDRFLLWPDAATILVYDSDTSTLAEGNNVLGLLRKFKASGFSGEIAWIRGGFTVVWKSARHLITEVPLSDESESGEEDSPSPSTSSGLLRAQNLSIAAFQQSTTTRSARSGHPAPPSSSSPVAGLGSAYVPSMDAAAPLTSTRVTAANFFFDNIRQNVELAQGITERIPLHLSPDIIARAEQQLPFKWLRDIVTRSEDEEADVLAMQFYKIELGEQRRMQGVMDHHTKNAFATEQNEFPYSISASIEKGTKNRYRDIYPFEHSRVKLGHGQTSEDGSDYVNASFIQPLGTDRRYIATQGPLPTTFTDFWTLCWEQNVSVIVMLTRQVEGAHLKCGSYWADDRFGQLRLDPISVEGPTEDMERNVQQAGGFNLGETKEETTAKFDPATSVIQRKFWLSNDSDKSTKPRHITQLQYLGWPDVNVPSDADGLLWLINAVDKAVEEARTIAEAAGSTIPPGPVLLHCSAGVGRTGGFIVVDAVLDALRRELRESAATAMQVDPSPSPSSSPPPPSRVSKGQAMAPPSSSESSGASAVGRAIAGTSSRSLLASRSIHRSGTPRSLLTTSTGGGDESSTNGYSSNPRLFDSSGAGNSSASSAEADSCDDVPMSEQSDDDGLRPSGGQSSVVEDAADGDLMCTPCVPATASGSTYFEAMRPSSSVSPPAQDVQGAAVELHSTSAFDYAPPRDVQSPLQPIRLDTLNEPIREVLEDMRKQRMSLCQSLRQYVFVHRAIIEGALAIVEEEQRAGRYSCSPSSTNATLPEDSLSKRGSLKRKLRSPDDEEPAQGRAHRSGAVRR